MQLRALRQATRDGGREEAVIAWHYPAEYGWDLPGIDADFAEIAKHNSKDPGASAV